MKSPYDEHGDISVESVNSLSTSELRHWLRTRVNGDDPRYAGSPGDLPHYLIAVIYPKLERLVRQDVENVVVDFLSELAAGTPRWEVNAANELLYLVDPVLLASVRRNEAIEHLTTICRRQDCDEVIRRSSLQALVSLDYFPSVGFWLDLFDPHSSGLIPVILEGVARSDLKAAFKWATVLANEGRELPILRYLIYLMPSLLDRYGENAVRSSMAEFFHDFPQDIQLGLEEFASLEGFSFAAEVERSGSLDFAAAVRPLLSLLALHLSHPDLGTNQNMLAVAQSTLVSLETLMPMLRHAVSLPHEEFGRIWESYGHCLRMALEFPYLAPLAYEHLVGHLPDPEVVEITDLVLHEGFMSEEACKSVLLRFYDLSDTQRVLGHHRTSEVREDAAEVFQVAIASMTLARPVMAAVQSLCAQDLKVPRDKNDWINGLLRDSDQLSREAGRRVDGN